MKAWIVTGLAALCAAAAPAGAVPGAEEQEETLVVSAHRRAVPLREVGSSVSVITADELEAQGVFYVEEALRRLAGVHASTSGGRGGQVAVRLRGEESYRTLVLLDGIRISDAALPQAAVNFGNLTVTAIERIEVLRGPQALLYGADAIGGVINIVTRRAASDEISVAAEAGSFGTATARGFASAARGPLDVALSGDWTRTGGISAKTGDPTLADDDGYRNLTLHGVAGLDLAEGVRLEAVARYVDAYAQFDGFSFDPDRELVTEELAGRVALTAQGGVLQHQISYAYFRSRRDDLDGGVPTRDFFGAPVSRFDSDRHEVEYLGIVTPVNGHGFTFGGNYRAEEVRTDSVHDTSADFAVFAEWQAEWNARFFTTLGLRYDAPENFSDHVSVRATTAYLIGDVLGGETKLRASAGTGFRAPSAFERAFNEGAGRPALEEETGFGFDAGFDHTFLDGRAEVSVTYFDQRIEDEIRFDNLGFTGYFQSSGTSHSRGAELAGSLELVPQLTLSGSYTYTDATVTSPDPEDGLPRVRRPRHAGSLDLDYAGTGGRLRVNLNVRGVDGVQDGFREFRTKLDDYMVMGTAASYAVADGVDVTLRATNLTDADYQEVAGFSTPGRAIFAGLRVRF